MNTKKGTMRRATAYREEPSWHIVNIRAWPRLSKPIFPGLMVFKKEWRDPLKNWAFHRWAQKAVFWNSTG
jgi:hypothetical protein